MYFESSIRADRASVGIKNFYGINRRKSSDLGEFYDMANLSNDDYPCLSSVRAPSAVIARTGIQKFIIPKFKEDIDLTKFTGIAENKLYIEGSEKASFSSVTDAVDFGGAVITIPEFKGYSYVTQGSSGNTIEPTGFTRTVTVAEDSNTETTTIEYGGGRTSVFQEGDIIALSGFTDDYAHNNTIYPKNSFDYTNTENPVSIIVTDVSASGTGSARRYKLTVDMRNVKNEKLLWGLTRDEMSFDDITVSKLMPKVSHICTLKNRLWAASESGESIFASALGEPLEFYRLGTLSTDSWSGDVGTPGKFVGIASWQNRVVAFKDDCIHVVFGDTPTDFSIEKNYTVGCIDGRSIASAGNMLIWLYYDGFYAYTGGTPSNISERLNTKYVSCSATSDGKKYYAFCKKEDGETELLVYDTTKGTWTKLSGAELLGGDVYRGRLYFYSSDGVYLMYGGGFGDFYADTPPISFDSFKGKAFIYINLRVLIADGGFLNVYTSTNGGEWKMHKGIDKSGRHKLPIRYVCGDTLGVRFEGSGDVTILAAELDTLTEDR